MRYTASEKKEIIDIVSASEIGVEKTLKELGIAKSNFYRWYAVYQEEGFDGLLSKAHNRKHFWNKIPSNERERIVEFALEHEALSPRELATKYTDEKKRFISESSVYRILKSRGLITSPAWIVMSASDKFHNQTKRPNEMWQTDFTYLKVTGWGWYYLQTVLDDHSRYIVDWDLSLSMEEQDVERLIESAMLKEGIDKKHAPKLLSDNGPCYIAGDLKDFLKERGVKHIHGQPLHPQTQGKIERWHRSMKNVVKLEHYYFPEELKRAIAEYIEYYNTQRYHESLENLTPEAVYRGFGERILNERKLIKESTMRERKSRNDAA